MNAETLAELERAAGLATPGPWLIDDSRHGGNRMLRVVAGLVGVCRVNSNLHSSANADLIALCSPENIKWLIARARRAEALERAIGMLYNADEASILRLAAHLEASSPQPSPAIESNSPKLS